MKGKRCTKIPDDGKKKGEINGGNNGESEKERNKEPENHRK